MSEEGGNAGSAHIDVVPRIIAGAAASLVASLAGPLAAATGVVGAAGLAMGAAVVGGIAVAFGAEVDFTGKLLAGTKQIRILTGETGENLTVLGQNFRNVVGTVAGTSVEAFADAIGQLNVRTGLAGPALEELTKQEARLAKLTKEDLGQLIPATTRLFGDWSVATEKQGGTLDYLFKVSQATGIGVTQLSESLVKFGAPLRQLGFTMEDSAAILGKFEKEGVNSNLVMGSMRIALGKMSKAGEDPIATFRRLTGEIKSAGTTGEANAKALQLFGARAGPDMAAAIREGRFEIGNLLDEIRESPETLQIAEEKTRSFSERIGIIFARLGVLFEPVGKVFYTFRTAVLDRVEAGVLALIALFQGDLPTAAEKMGVALGTAANSPAVAAVLRLFKTFQDFAVELRDHGIGAAFDVLRRDLADAWPHIRTVLEGLGQNFLEWGTTLFDAAVEWGRSTLAGLAELWPKLVTWIQENGPRLVAELHTWANAFGAWLADAIPPLLEKLGEWLGALVGWIFDHLPQIIGAILVMAYHFVTWVGEITTPLLIKLGELLLRLGGWILTEALPHIASKLGEWAVAFWEWLQVAVPPMLEKLGELLVKLGIWLNETGLPKLKEKLSEWAGAFWGWVQEAVPKLLENLGGWLATLGNWITETALPWIIQKLVDLAFAFVGWITTAASNLPGNLWDFAMTIAAWIKDSAVPWLIEKAKELVPALMQWLSDAKDDLPGKLADLAFGILTWLKDELPGKIRDAAGGLFNGLANSFLGFVNFLIRTWNGLKLEIPKTTIFGQDFGPFSFDTPDLPEIPYLAQGGRAIAPGLAVVGDGGAEVVRLGRGDTVFPMDRAGEISGTDGRLLGDVNIHEATSPGAVLTELESVLGWRYGTRKTA